MSQILKLYTDRRYVNPNVGHLPLLYPFWGNCDSPSIDKGRFDEWTRVGTNYVSLVPINECDGVLFPSGWRSCYTNFDDWRLDYRNAMELSAQAEKFGKKLLIFFNNDSDEDVPIPNSLIFRTSFYRSKRKEHEFALPGWAVDFQKKYPHIDFTVREKSPIPTVGYAGYVDYRNLLEWIKFIARRLRHPGNHRIGAHLRGIAIRRMLKSQKVLTKFLLRDGCLTGRADVQTREEYVKCILDSDYCLVTRGGGNFSYRLYEILSCGRIPLLIDTDCVLPFDHILDWKKICLWVDQTMIEAIADIVWEFHLSLSEEEFKQMEHRARRVYEDWISPTGFYSNIWRCIENEAAINKQTGIEII